MACVWAHGPDIHLDARAYQIEAADFHTTPEPVAVLPSGRPRRRVLLVDDDLDMSGTMSDALEAEGYEVTSCSNGHDALAARPETFDAVILDLKMPRMSGEELKRALDQRGVIVPVILFSSDERVADYAASLACFDYLHKPPDIDHVHSAVMRAVARKDAITGSHPAYVEIPAPPPGSRPFEDDD